MAISLRSKVVTVVLQLLLVSIFVMKAEAKVSSFLPLDYFMYEITSADQCFANNRYRSFNDTLQWTLCSNSAKGKTYGCSLYDPQKYLVVDEQGTQQWYNTNFLSPSDQQAFTESCRQNVSCQNGNPFPVFSEIDCQCPSLKNKFWWSEDQVIPLLNASVTMQNFNFTLDYDSYNPSSYCMLQMEASDGQKRNFSMLGNITIDLDIIEMPAGGSIYFQRSFMPGLNMSTRYSNLSTTTSNRQISFPNIDTVYMILNTPAPSLNGAKWSLNYSMSYAKYDEIDYGIIYGTYISLIPGGLMFIIAFIAFEVPYLKERQAEKARLKEEQLQKEADAALIEQNEKAALVTAQNQDAYLSEGKADPLDSLGDEEKAEFDEIELGEIKQFKKL